MRHARPIFLTSTFVLVVLAVAARGDVKVPAAATSETARAVRGSWQLARAKAVRDSCGGSVVLAAQHVDIGADSLRADIVDRVYAYRGASERSEARFEGEFSERGQCAGINLHETWRLDLAKKHGTLESTWKLPPSCASPCTIEFAFDLQKVPAPRPE